MASIEILDFSGGKNVADNQILVGDNQCVSSASKNVWAPGRTLTKMPGVTVAYTVTSTGCLFFQGTCLYSDEVLTTASNMYVRCSKSATGAGALGEYLHGLESGVLKAYGYTTGTIAIGGVSATGVGTSWSSQVTAGDIVGPSATPNSWNVVSTVEDDTHLTLAAGVTGTINAGTAYTIQQGLSRVEVAWASIVATGDRFIINSTEADWMQLTTTAGTYRLAAGPRAAYLATHRNYVFAARTLTAQARVYWSALKDPITWPATNFVDLGTDKITGMISYAGELIVFQTRGMHKITGEIFDPSNPTYSVSRIATPGSFAFNSNWSAAVHNGVLVFFAMGRFYQYLAGTNSIQEISSPINADLPSAFTGLTSVAAIEQRIHAISFNGYYIVKGLQYASGEPTIRAYVLDRNAGWWLYSDSTGQNTSRGPLGQSPLVIEPQTSGPPRLVTVNDGGAAAGDGRFYALDFNDPAPYEDQFLENDDGTSKYGVDSVWLSKEYNIDYGHFKKAIVYLKKQSAGSLTFEWSVDQGSFVSSTIDMTVGRGNLIRKVLDINQKGSTIQVRLSHSTSDQTFEVYGIRLIYDPILEDRKV